MNALVVALVVALVAGASGFGLGWYESDLRWTAKTAQDASKRQEAIDEADRRARAAEIDLEVARGIQRDSERKLSNALRQSTAGRVCLAERTRLLINAAAAGARLPDQPDDGGGPRTAAASGGSTDTQVADWASRVIAQYEGCRAQLAAVRAALPPIGGGR